MFDLRRHRPRAAALAAALFGLLAAAGEGARAQGWAATGAASPSARGWAALAEHRASGAAVLFGGWDGTAKGDTWEWNGSAWRQRITGVQPAPRCCHAMAYDPIRQVLVLFGGADAAGNDLHDTWEWNGTSWRDRTPAVSPAPRRLHALAYDPVSQRTLMFGGGTGGLGVPTTAETWAWDGTAWTPATPATIPSPRWGHCMATDWVRGRVVLFGGVSTGTLGGLADTWEWNGSDWVLMQTAVAPPPRNGAGMACDPLRGRVLLYGGWDGRVFFRDTWVWNGIAWDQLPTLPNPGDRRVPCMTGHVAQARVVLFGGYDGGFLSDTWLHRSPSPASYTTFGAGCPGSAGVPTLSAEGGTLPWIGQTLALQVGNVPASQPVVFLFGMSRSAWAGGALPASLAGAGMPGCDLLVRPDVALPVGSAGGVARFGLQLANQPSWIGAQFHNQAVVRDPAINQAGLTVSNGGSATIGAR